MTQNQNEVATGEVQLQSDPAPLMVRLKTETRLAHDAAESTEFMKLLAAGTLPREVYGRSVKQIGYVRSVLEQALGAAKSASPAVNSVVKDHHQQAHLYMADSRFWNVQFNLPLETTAELCSRVRGLANADPLLVLGPFYVLEGSNFGATILRKSLQKMYDMGPDEPGLSSLDPHGNELVPRWRQFTADVNALDLSDSQKDQIIAAALDTFNGIREIYEEVCGTESSLAS